MIKIQGPPKRIAKYEIERVLGSGAMGVVYKGFDSQIERVVAIKLLHEHLRQGENGDELEVRFLQEAKAAARCLHPNIVAIFDFGRDAAPYIVMEYVEGIELRAYMRSETAIALPSATDITIQVLAALSHAHDKGIVHRDIKPDNIILLESGAVKVSDFGVARLDTSDLTGTGYMIGTPNYMSPEGLQGNHCDSRSDLYSVGILFYELASQGRFNRDQNLSQNLERLNNCSELSGKSRRSIQKILARALDVDPDGRYQNADEFIHDLKSIDDMDLTLATLAVFPRPSDYEVTMPRKHSSSAVSQWNSELLDALEQSLARYVGPMAKLLIKKGTRTANSLEELLAQLVEHIPNQAERTQFIKAVDSSGIHRSQTQSITSEPVQPGHAKDLAASFAISPEQLRGLSEMLTFYTGPIARRMIDRLARKAVSLEALITSCSKQIPDENERRIFLQRCQQLKDPGA